MNNLSNGKVANVGQLGGQSNNNPMLKGYLMNNNQMIANLSHISISQFTAANNQLANSQINHNSQANKTQTNNSQMNKNQFTVVSQLSNKSHTSNAQIVNNQMNGSQLAISNQATPNQATNKPVIERGASWSFNETRALLNLWGQDLVQRQLTNSKRTRHVWEKIAEKINELGYSRSADQVRTRVFNMIAEYRRIIKDPTPERRKKCTFFAALAKIYEAKDANGVRAALDNYEEDQHYDQIEFNNSGENQENYMSNFLIDNLNSETSDLEDREVFSYAMSPSHLSMNSQPYSQIGHVQMNGFDHHVVQLNNNGSGNRTPTNFLNSQSLNTSMNSNADQLGQLNLLNQAAAIQRLKQHTASQQNSRTNSLSGDHYSDNHSDNSRDQFTNSNQLNRKNNNKQARSSTDYTQIQKRRRINDSTASYQQQQTINSSTFLNGDPCSSSFTDTTALFIDKMFDHLAQGTEAMREWIKLEERRLDQDIQRKKEERAREERREQKYLDAFVKMQDQMFQFLSGQRKDPLGIVGEARNLNLVDNLRKELSNKDDGEEKRKSTTSEQRNEKQFYSIELKSAEEKSQDGTVSAQDEDAEEVNDLQDVNLQTTTSLENDPRTFDSSASGDQSKFNLPESNLPTTIITLNGLYDTDSNANLLEQTKTTVSDVELISNTNQPNNHIIIAKPSDKSFISLLASNNSTPLQPPKINEAELIENHQQQEMQTNLPIVEFLCKDEIIDNENNTYSFINVQHEEIVN